MAQQPERFIPKRSVAWTLVLVARVWNICAAYGLVAGVAARLSTKGINALLGNNRHHC